MDLLEGLKEAREKKTKTHGRYAFLKYKEEIKEALEDGHTAINIWEHLHNKGEMPIKYNQFTVYVRRFIRNDTQHHYPLSLRHFKYKPINIGPRTKAININNSV